MTLQELVNKVKALQQNDEPIEFSPLKKEIELTPPEWLVLSTAQKYMSDTEG